MVQLSPSKLTRHSTLLLRNLKLKVDDKFEKVENFSLFCLLVVVDTHKSSFVDFPTLYEKASATVVIDHHRTSVDHIKDCLLYTSREHLFAFFLHLEGVEDTIAPVPQRE